MKYRFETEVDESAYLTKENSPEDLEVPPELMRYYGNEVDDKY